MNKKCATFRSVFVVVIEDERIYPDLKTSAFMFHKSESVFVNIYIHSRGKDTEKYNFLTQSDKIKFIESIHTKMVCNMLMQDVILSKRCCPLFDPFLDGVFICIPDVHYLVWPSTNTKSLDILF